MHIDGKIEDGYVIICDEDHSFVANHLGLAVECTHCGRLALGVDLAELLFSSYEREHSTRNDAMETSTVTISR
ncbi:hypothetical protein [Pelagibius sp. Alg239-R121]|uniref:hypothetical protein n=1 Tax=Pelagibius sp. Alg239-R121 TaxID=2993448 RepID=UPI0024A626BA|nr:hypothetical protein [Pelagibius sp. Alg239-R121]